MEEEVWKDIEGYRGLYQISNHGRVKCLDKWIQIGKRKRLISSKTLKLKLNKCGYFHIGLRNGIKRKWFTIHRLVALHFIKNEENKREVNHIDGIKINNYYKNLEWVTTSENGLHAFKTGLCKPTKGEKDGMAKLSETDIYSIRKLCNMGISRKSIAFMYGLNKNHVCSIYKRHCWKHLP